jgi:hypothetical protein
MGDRGRGLRGYEHHIEQSQPAHRCRHDRDPQVFRDKADNRLLKLRFQPDGWRDAAGAAEAQDLMTS